MIKVMIKGVTIYQTKTNADQAFKVARSIGLWDNKRNKTLTSKRQSNN